MVTRLAFLTPARMPPAPHAPRPLISPHHAAAQAKKSPAKASGASDTGDDLDASMEEAQQEADVLRAVVVPMEKELVQLRLRLKVRVGGTGGDVTTGSPHRQLLPAFTLPFHAQGDGKPSGGRQRCPQGAV